MEKVCEHLDSVTCWPFFGSNNLNKTFLVVADEERLEFSLCVQFSVQQYSWDVWCESRSSHSISLRLRSEVRLGASRRRTVFCWSHSDEVLMLVRRVCCATSAMEHPGALKQTLANVFWTVVASSVVSSRDPRSCLMFNVSWICQKRC